MLAYGSRKRRLRGVKQNRELFKKNLLHTKRLFQNYKRVMLVKKNIPEKIKSRNFRKTCRFIKNGESRKISVNK